MDKVGYVQCKFIIILKEENPITGDNVNETAEHRAE